MQKDDTLYVCAVSLFAVVFSAVTVMNSAGIMAERADGGRATASAGESRDVDVQRIEGLIREQRLSDHEASFYEAVDPAAPSGESSRQAPSARTSGQAPP